MKHLRLVFQVLAAAVGVLLLIVTLWAVRQHTRDPLDAIHRNTGRLVTLEDSAYHARTTAGEERTYRDIVIATEDDDTIRLTLSLPTDTLERPLPLVFILAGLRTGRESLASIDVHGPNLIVGYEYPYDPADWERGSALREVLRIRRAVLSVPSQVHAAAAQLRALPEVDASRTALLGYSFGALFVPAAQRVAMAEDSPFEALILAYAGVDLRALIDTNLRVDPAPLRGGLARIAATALAAMEPARHLPHLTGRFLVIRGEHDHQIPAELSTRLAELTPGPKEVITLDAGHMGPRDPELTARVVRISQDWLASTGIIELPTRDATD